MERPDVSRRGNEVPVRTLSTGTWRGCAVPTLIGGVGTLGTLGTLGTFRTAALSRIRDKGNWEVGLHDAEIRFVTP